MSRRAKRSLLLVLLLLLLLLAAGFCAFALPWLLAGSAMPEDAVLELEPDEAGALLLRWPAVARAESYLVRVLRPGAGEDGADEELFARSVTEPGLTLPALPTDETLRLSVETQRSYWFPGARRIRAGDVAATALTALAIPEAVDLSWEPDPEDKSLTLSWQARAGDRYDLYLSGEAAPLQSTGEGSLTLRFGEGGDLDLPAHGEPLYFAVRALRQSPGLLFRGPYSEAVTLTREDLLGRELDLCCAHEGDNFYVLTWNETKGARYAVQRWDDAAGDWTTLAEFDRADERRYETGRLASSRSYRLRVAALGGQTLPESAYAAGPEEVAFRTEASPIYATVWPVEELALYADAGRTETLGKVAAATTLCVLDEAEGLFYVRTALGLGYVDSGRCLINLPDYAGELCGYDITNSYASLYMVHEYEIPEVTDTVVEGYEDVELAEGEYLVPLLYPTAQKLLDAARAALEDGYRLKIYDAYRPNRATRAIYDLTYEIMEEPIPEETFTGEEPDDLPELPEDVELTYYLLMTNDTWSLGNFLATTGSYHNMGIALDLTLEDAATGAELEMQTRMHDLSHYSVIYENNDSADRLAGYMKAAGFGGLTSEWWHFQDNDSRDSLGLTAFMWAGVSPEGWRADDGGWRYRRADGGYVTSASLTLGGTAYSFDAQGYAAPRDW